MLLYWLCFTHYAGLVWMLRLKSGSTLGGEIRSVSNINSVYYMYRDYRTSHYRQWSVTNLLLPSFLGLAVKELRRVAKWRIGVRPSYTDRHDVLTVHCDTVTLLLFSKWDTIPYQSVLITHCALLRVSGITLPCIRFIHFHYWCSTYIIVI